MHTSQSAPDVHHLSPDLQKTKAVRGREGGGGEGKGKGRGGGGEGRGEEGEGRGREGNRVVSANLSHLLVEARVRQTT